jgi:hypothetical protein
MRLGELFRIRHACVAILLILFFVHPAHALWLDVATQWSAAVAPLALTAAAPKPPVTGDQRHGLFALPSYQDAAVPRLKLQYRADFPLSVTFETDGALAGSRLGAAGALSFSTRIVLIDKGWVPQLGASVADFNVEEIAHGRLEAGNGILRGEWRVKF